jgi:hypothetical protein
MSYRKINIIKVISILILSLSFLSGTPPKEPSFEIGLLKYNGGGDWYANPTALPNLVEFCNKNIKSNISKEIGTVEVGSADIYNYPFIHMTGHGNVVFSNEEAQNLRNYCLGGGFLHIDDNYGMDKFIRTEIQKVFPNNEFVELPSNHPIFLQHYKFKNGIPKIHEHDGKPAQAFGIIHKGRLVCFYTYETDLGDGWEDQQVHNDPENKRLESLKMGANIIQYAFSVSH